MDAAAKRHRVMIVDDFSEFRLALARSLKALGHRVAAVSTAEEALSLLDAIGPDVLIVDVHLPGMWGDRLVETVRQRQDGMRDVPAVLMSAHIVPDVENMLKRSGASALWDKVQISLDSLPDLINRAATASPCRA